MNKKTKIVFVEDDELIRENYTDLLEDEGYSVQSFADRMTAYDAITNEQPDLAIIDIGLGRERDGGKLLVTQLREVNKSLPIIFLTSYDSDDDRIDGMRYEVDDYISKSESIDYLIVRIKTLLIRVSELLNNNREISTTIEHGDLLLDTEASLAYWKNELLDITLTQYWILKELAIRPGHTKSPSKLMEAANTVVETNTIAANIKSIRKAFRSIDPEFDCIKAVYAAGYRWVNASD